MISHKKFQDEKWTIHKIIYKIDFIFSTYHKVKSTIMSDTRTETTTSSTEMGFREAKDAHKEQMLQYAVQWAKSLKCMDAEKNMAKFNLEYLQSVIGVFDALMENSDEEGVTAALEKVGTMERFVGKTIHFDGKPFQPVVNLPEVRTESGAIPSKKRIGMERLICVTKRATDLKNDCADMDDVRPSLIWKQKFYRYGYNHNVEKMAKYHQKISDYEAERLDKIMEQDANGTLGQVVFHNTEEISVSEDCSDMDLGKAMMEDTRRIGDGQFVREYGDRIKNAYEIRSQLIDMTKGFNDVPKAERATHHFVMNEVVNVVAEGTMPNLI